MAVLAIWSGSACSQGQGDNAGPPRKNLIDLNEAVTFEISPHTGLMGGSGTFGLRMSMNYSSLNLELAGEQVIGKTANLYPLSVNVLLNLATRGRLIPYGAVGAGLMLTTPTNSIGDESVTTLGLNFGGGARYYITRSFGVRVEAKQYVTSVHSERESNTELLFFQEVSVGVTFMLR
jgi:opacity protein-like surface antigen